MAPDEDRRLREEFGLDAALARDLLRLGPVILLQEQAEEDEPDPAFLDRLGARLGVAALDAPDPVVLHNPRTPRRHPMQRPRRRAVVWASLLVAVFAVVLVIVVLGPLHTSPRPPVRPAEIAAAQLPQPGVSDLTQDFPMPPGMGGGGGGGGLSPIASPLDPPQNAPYPGHLRLTIRMRTSSLLTVPAYRLRGPSFDAPRIAIMAHSLDIRAPATQVMNENVAWFTAVDTPTGATRSIHSVAIATRTGELLYRDTSYLQQTTALPIHGKADAIAAARTWLTRLGWPAGRMPVLSASVSMDTAAHPWDILLGWSGIGPATTPAARLWVLPRGRVVEARVFPPVAQVYQVIARPLVSVQRLVQQGRTPVAVIMISTPTSTPSDGQGTIDRVEVIQVLTARADGTLYLVPAYRFSGVAQLQITSIVGASRNRVLSRAVWYSLVAAARL